MENPHDHELNQCPTALKLTDISLKIKKDFNRPNN